MYRTYISRPIEYEAGGYEYNTLSPFTQNSRRTTGRTPRPGPGGATCSRNGIESGTSVRLGSCVDVPRAQVAVVRLVGDSDVLGLVRVCAADVRRLTTDTISV